MPSMVSTCSSGTTPKPSPLQHPCLLQRHVVAQAARPGNEAPRDPILGLTSHCSLIAVLAHLSSANTLLANKVLSMHNPRRRLYADLRAASSSEGTTSI